MSATGPSAGAPWLAPFQLAEGEAATFRIASLALQVTRRAREWRVQSATTHELGAIDVDVRCPDPAPGPLPFTEEARLVRYACDGTDEALQLRPRLADRPVVVRPADKLVLLPGATVDVYVSTIVWVALELARSGVVLQDVPALRPSDTWFGASTRDGELAYASRTSARLDVRDLPVRPHRATTCLRLTNAGRQPQALARVMLPAPSLELWRMPSGMLWTQTVEVTLGEGDETPLRFRPGPPHASVALARNGEAAPPSAEPAVLVAPARRQTATKNLLLRAMSAIF